MKKRFRTNGVYMSKGERNGILLFFLLSMMIIVGTRYVLSDPDRTTIIQYESKKRQQNYHNQQKSSFLHKKSKKAAKHKSGFRKIKFVFDPNLLSDDSLRMLGFSDFVVNNISKYREKGGKFRHGDDLKKVFGMDESLLQSLMPYIQIENKSERINDETRLTYEKKPMSELSKIDDLKNSEILELNSADSSQLVSLKGIGPFYAKKILSMKNKMGGYFSKEQLLECGILPEEVYFKIENQILTDPGKMERIQINKADFKTLIQHPYLSENLVKIILKYRENHGPFSSLEELKNIKIMTKEKFDKLINHFKI